MNLTKILNLPLPLMRIAHHLISLFLLHILVIKSIKICFLWLQLTWQNDITGYWSNKFSVNHMLTMKVTTTTLMILIIIYSIMLYFFVISNPPNDAWQMISLLASDSLVNIRETVDLPCAMCYSYSCPNSKANIPWQSQK